MLLEKRSVLLEAMEFIIDAVALSTEGQSHADVAIYLMSLLVADQKQDIQFDRLDAIRDLIRMADSMNPK